MSAVATKPASAAHRRRCALDPYLERLRHLVAQDDTQAIEVEGQPVSCESWMLEEIREIAHTDGFPADPERGLLAQAAALQFKIAEDTGRLERLRRAPTQEIYARQAELMLDAAMALALLRELQQAVDGHVRAGRMELAKRWTRLRNTLHATAAGLKRRLAESERTRAESLADSMTDEPRNDTAAPDRYAAQMRRIAEMETERKRLARARRRTREALGNLPSRTEILVASLAVAAAVWLGFVLLPQRVATTLPVLGLDDFPRTDGFLRVDARPPSLYLTVDAGTWSALGAQERLHVVGTLSSVLLGNGYRGALIQDEHGRPVARWLAQRGVELPEQGEMRAEPSAETLEQGGDVDALAGVDEQREAMPGIGAR